MGGIDAAGRELVDQGGRMPGLAKAWTMRRRFSGAFVIALLALIVTVPVNVEAGRTRAAAVRTAREISAIQALTEELFVTYVNEQITVSGFLDTGRDEDLLTLEADLASDQQALEALRTAADGRELFDVDAVAVAARDWHEAIQRNIAMRRKLGKQRVQPVDATTSAEVPDAAGQRWLFTRLTDQVLSIQREVALERLAVRNEFDAASASVTRLLYISLALAAALLGILLLLVRRWVLAPLSVILGAVAAVRDGDMEATVPAVGPPELAQLGTYVDEMRQAVLSRGKAAMEAESQLRLLIDSLPDCVIIRLHPDGSPATWSAAAERLTGYTADQRLGRSTAELDLPDDPSAEVLRSALARAAAGETVRTRRRRLHADGTEILVDNALSAIRDDAGTVLGFAVVARDVTAAVAAEQALELAHEQAAERAARLQETAQLLENTNRELLAANKEMEAFTYTVSHDLRAPLRAIVGFSRILLDGQPDDSDTQSMHYLNRVATNAIRMSQLIDDLLAFSKLRSRPLAKTATPLAEVVHSAWEELAHSNLEATVVLDVAELPTLPVDPSLLRQVFVNLLGNGMKFSAQSPHPRLDVKCGADPAGSGQPVITVRDNGIGFESAQAERLFEVFTRLHSEQDYEGTGIGLSIVHRIITRHGGRVWAEADPGQGAVFSFTLGPDTLPVRRSGTGPPLPRTRGAAGVRLGS